MLVVAKSHNPGSLFTTATTEGIADMAYRAAVIRQDAPPAAAANAREEEQLCSCVDLNLHPNSPTLNQYLFGVYVMNRKTETVP